MASNFPKTFATVNDIPNDLLILIFEYLKIKDLIRCSLVCKRFKLLCQNARIPELIISDTGENIRRYWFYTNIQFNHKDAINVTTFNSYRSIFRLDKFRRLYFEGIQSEYNQLKVSDLTQLEQLKINVEEEFDAKLAIHINLPNLKIVEIDKPNHKFFITAPKLEVLRCRNFDMINLTYPNTVSHLETDNFKESFNVLKNLQFLLIAYTGEFNWSNTLSAFPKLATLSCHGTAGIFPVAIENLVKYKRSHQLSLPKIYFLSVDLDELKNLDECRYNGDSFPFEINNYNSLAEFVHITVFGIDYNGLLDSMNGKIPNDFFKKYFGTRCVCVRQKVENPEHLLEFLKNFDFLTELNFYYVSLLDQSFYNRLGELDQLTRLTVNINLESSSTSSKSTFNFDFLLRLKQLMYFRTNIDSPTFFDLTLELCKQLKYIRSIRFAFDEYFVSIWKNEMFINYELMYCHYKKCQLDLNGLVREMDAIKSGHINPD